jgi:hypothetical protein
VIKILSKLLARKIQLENMHYYEPRRAIIVHNHLFKNAGSSIDWALKENFGRSFIDHRDDNVMRKGAEYLGPYLTGNSDIHAVSTHHLTLPLPNLEDIKLLQLMMFRHPIERVTSVYKYERKQTRSSTPGAIHAQKLSLKDYILWRMEPHVGPTIRNFHVIRSIPVRKVNRSPVTADELQMAIEVIQSISLLGLVEKFDESMVMFEEVLCQYFPSIDMSYKTQNINQDKKTSQEDRIIRLQEEIGDEVYQLLLSNNQKDIELYSTVIREFDKRKNTVSDFTSKLYDFQERCKKHTN